MPQNYVPVFLFLALVGILIPFALLTARIVRRRGTDGARETPSGFEVGVDGGSPSSLSMRFYAVAALVVVFETAIIFLYAWAVKFKSLGVFGLVEMAVFLGVLIVGYIWAWKNRALEWE
jgi:NADH-quinone oxidoreductase subunit A